MSDFYIASFSLDDDSLCHYGRPGMKWGQHIFGKENKSNKRLRKETKKSLKRLRALEENVRIKNAIRQPAKDSVRRAEAALEENIKKYGKGKLFESKASKERRMQAIRTAEYNVERNRELADKAERLFEVASEAYKKEAKNVERLVNESIKAVGKENVRDIKYQKEAEDLVFKFINTGVRLPSANKQAKIILEAEKEYRDNN